MAKATRGNLMFPVCVYEREREFERERQAERHSRKQFIRVLESIEFNENLIRFHKFSSAVYCLLRLLNTLTRKKKSILNSYSVFQESINFFFLSLRDERKFYTIKKMTRQYSLIIHLIFFK